MAYQRWYGLKNGRKNTPRGHPVSGNPRGARGWNYCQWNQLTEPRPAAIDSRLFFCVHDASPGHPARRQTTMPTSGHRLTTSCASSADVVAPMRASVNVVGGTSAPMVKPLPSRASPTLTVARGIRRRQSPTPIQPSNQHRARHSGLRQHGHAWRRPCGARAARRSLP